MSYFHLSNTTYGLLHYGWFVEELIEALSKSPASILRQFFIDKGLTWDCFVGHSVRADNTCSVSDEEGEKQNRLMVGEEVFRHGVLVRLRSLLYDTLWAKVQELRTWCEEASNVEVTLGEDTFVLNNISIEEVPGKNFEEDTKVMDMKFLLTICEDT